MPIDPANDVNIVLPFFVSKLLRLNDKAVLKCIIVLPYLNSFGFSFLFNGCESSVICPSNIFIILSEYSSASLSLWVTIIINLSLETFFNISITPTEVLESKAPVGSSARIISGSFTKALAMATLCICPPESSFGL